MGATDEPRHDLERARTAIILGVVAVLCVLTGFVVGVARSHAQHSPRPVTVETTVAISGPT
jgi:hypothetical protein